MKVCDMGMLFPSIAWVLWFQRLKSVQLLAHSQNKILRNTDEDKRIEN